ncbi:SDR family oxidoreductase [Antrihabitans sp. NCIMB 15449]|uniref:SDR family oxidoreductase n=1 Tax=Antrihabitans spumae TaxID=3373370 RepID=A0ABW7JY84_9NOCA
MTDTKPTDATDTAHGISERFVRNGEIEIAVYEQGNPDGETIILVHGWPDTHRLWEGVVPFLADRFHVVSYDTRGHGRTTNPDSYRDFELSALASDFFAVADAVSPDRPVHVLAHDWGSISVWEAVCEPAAEERIASFTSASGPNLDHVGKWMRRRLSRPTPKNVWQPVSQLLSSGYTFLFMTPALPKALFGLGNESHWKTFLKVVEGTDSDRIFLADTLKQDLVNGLRIYRANIVQRIFNSRERETKVPVQLIVDTKDVAIRPAGYDDESRWTERLWRRDVNAGHWVPFSHPQVLAQATIELIDALSGKEPTRELRRARVRKAERRHFDDQLLVITGGGSGIGRETALAFAREGAEVVLSDVNLASAKETATLIAELGGVAHAYQLDVSDEDAVQAHADHVAEKHGVPDILINNAGIGQAGGFFDTPAATFRKVIDISLFGVINGSRSFGAKMVERGLGGQIVNLSSMAAFGAQQGFSPYATSKSAVFMFSDCLRSELASANIGVSTICPGIVHTNITNTTEFSGVSSDEQAQKQAKFDRLYQKRGYTPDKVADCIVDAVKTNKSIVPVTPEAHLSYHFSRLAPALVRFGAANSNLIK